MNITATSLSRLDAGSSYYLSNTTGTIKKANLWQWIKCFTGFGDGREKVQRLAEVVKASLLANAELKQDNVLDVEIDRLRTTRSLSGASLRDIANRFKTAHADAIAAVDARREASRIAEQVADASVAEWVTKERVLAAPENVGYIRKIALYSVQHLVQKAYDDRENRPDLQGRMEAAMRKAVENINSIEFMQDGHFLGLREGMFMLSAVLPLAGLSAEEFGLRLLALAAVSKRVTDALSRTSAESGGAPAADPPPGSQDNDFMRV